MKNLFLAVALFVTTPSVGQRIQAQSYTEQAKLQLSDMPDFSKAAPYEINKQLHCQPTPRVSFFQIENLEEIVKRPAGVRTYFEDKTGRLTEIAAIVQYQGQTYISTNHYGKIWTIIENKEVLFIDVHVIHPDKNQSYYRQYYHFRRH